MIAYALAPVTGRHALRWIEETHRHLPKLQGALFAAGVTLNGQLVGVATTGNPPRVWLGTGRIIITRCAAIPGLPRVIANDGTDRPAPACTMLYGALCRAAKALGWSEAWTYTLPGEDGYSLRAAGFTFMGWTKGEEWDRPSRSRASATSAAPKGRWMRKLSPSRLNGDAA